MKKMCIRDRVDEISALGILETYDAASIIEAADQAAKTAIVDLIELRIAKGMCGKSYIDVYKRQATVRCLQHFPDLCRMILSAVQSRDFNREGKTWTIWIQRAGCLMSSDILSMTDLE